MLIQPEIAEGDVLEAFPLLLQRIAILFGFAIFAGGFGYIYGNKQVLMPSYSKMKLCSIMRLRFKT